MGTFCEEEEKSKKLQRGSYCGRRPIQERRTRRGGESVTGMSSSPELLLPRAMVMTERITWRWKGGGGKEGKVEHDTNACF